MTKPQTKPRAINQHKSVKTRAINPNQLKPELESNKARTTVPNHLKPESFESKINGQVE